MKHGLLLFFNHPFRKVRTFLAPLYRERFDEVHVLTPPEDVSRSDDPGTTYYYSGSYNFAVAFSYLLARPEIFQEMDWITVMHDDVMLHPAYPFPLEAQLADRPDFIGPAAEQFPEGFDWTWNFRNMGRVFCSKDPVLGDGAENPLRDLAALYESAPGGRHAPTDLKIGWADLLNLGAKGAVARKFWRSSKKLIAHLGVPTFPGNADFFVVRGDKFRIFCHYSGVLARCGLFAEMAVPTSLHWMAACPGKFLPGQLDWIYDLRQADTKFSVRQWSDIPLYFERYPQTVAAHPVKMSRLVPSA